MKKYEKPVLEIVEFENLDVIMSSAELTNDEPNTENPLAGDEDKVIDKTEDDTILTDTDSTESSEHAESPVTPSPEQESPLEDSIPEAAVPENIVPETNVPEIPAPEVDTPVTEPSVESTEGSALAPEVEIMPDISEDAGPGLME